MHKLKMARNDSKSSRVTAAVSPETEAKLDRYALAKMRARSDIVNIVIQRLVRKQESKPNIPLIRRGQQFLENLIEAAADGIIDELEKDDLTDDLLELEVHIRKRKTA